MSVLKSEFGNVFGNLQETHNRPEPFVDKGVRVEHSGWQYRSDYWVPRKQK